MNEIGIVGLENLTEALGADAAFLEQLGVEIARHVLRVEEQLASRCVGEYVGGRQVEHLHDHRQLFGLVLARKDRIAREQLN